MTGLSYYITCWYWQLDGTKVYNNIYCWNIACKSGYSILEEHHLLRSVNRDVYIGIGLCIKFDTYSWATICANETISPFVKYKFDNHPDMSEAIMQFTM